MSAATKNRERVMVKLVRLPAGVEGFLDSALDAALSGQQDAVVAHVEHIRAKRPHATPAEVVAVLESRYQAAAIAVGVASGGVSAIPGVGTAASVATGLAEITAFVEATALFAQSLSYVYGLQISDRESRRALVLALLLGESGTAVLEGAAGRGVRWTEVLARGGHRDGVGRINRMLARRAATHFGARQGTLLLGRALPFGVGAGVGAVGNRVLARQTIKAARRAFGPPPEKFGPRVV